MDLMKLTGELKYGKILQSGKSLLIMTPLARLDFCELAEATQFQGSGPFRYGVDVIFETDPAKPGAVDLKKVVMPALFEFAKEKGITPQQVNEEYAGGKRGYIFGGDKLTIRVGQRISAAGEAYSGYETSSVSLHASNRPKVQAPPWRGVPCVSPSGEPDFDPRSVYNGCYGRVIINPYKPKKWTMIAIGLQGVQMIADGESLGGEGAGAASCGAFGAIEGAAVQSSFEKGMHVADPGGVTPSDTVDPAQSGDFSAFVS